MKLLPKVIRSIWLIALLAVFSFDFANNAGGMSVSRIAYDGQGPFSIAYDGSSVSAFNYDPGPFPSANEKENQSARSSGDFSHFAGFLAAEGIPRVTGSGLARVEAHLDDVLANQFSEFSRADQLTFQAGERGMLDRLRSGATSSQDIEFYMHELKESARFRATGNLMDSHNAALQWRGVTSQELFHPEVIRANPSVFPPSWQP
jgi:hypothetical protein